MQKTQLAVNAWQTACACSGDYGVGFFGHAHNSGAYLVYKEFGIEWLCFLCNYKLEAAAAERSRSDPDRVAPQPLPSAVTVTLWPKDSFHRRVYIQPLGLYLIAEAGVIEKVRIDFAKQTVNISFEALGEQLMSAVRLRMQLPAAAKKLSVWLRDTSPLQGSQANASTRSSSLVCGSASRGAQVNQKICNEGICSSKFACIRGAYQMRPKYRAKQSWVLLEWDCSMQSVVAA